MDVSTLSIDHDPIKNRKIINKKYRTVKKIGQGQFGKVLLAENKAQDNKYVAIKTINRIDKTRLITKTYLNHATKIKREIQIMKECNHPNVVKLYQVIDDLKYDKILLILEYCKFGEINWKTYNHYYAKYYKKNGLTINKILRDVVNGLEYLHDFKKIIHRDLKPSNLLINHDNTIKISDFGVSLILENNANDDKELGKAMGTPAFFAPELCQFVNNRLSMIHDLDNKIKIDARIDLWSLGAILYCLIFNDLPFNGFNEFELFKKIVNDELKFPKIKNTSRTNDDDIKELKHLKNLIKRLLTKDPNKRITLQEIKNHDFTLFDLDSTEKVQFLSFNKNIFQRQQKPKQLAIETVGLTSKIKKFFTGKQETRSLPPKLPSFPKSLDPSKINELEPVDDLLDSYLDDSSSFGSDLEDDIDTTNLLESLNKTDKPDKLKPPPLILQNSTVFEQYKPPQANNFPNSVASNSSPNTPTNSNIITIGAGSPSSFKSIFSPSTRFFARNKGNSKEVNEKPTISSLSSPEKKKHNGNQTYTKYTDLVEPPPLFGSNIPIPSPTSNSSQSNVGSSSRKNSISSVKSGNALSRITSSNSSLNLHAYLTDDTLSLTSTKNFNTSKFTNENDTENEDDEQEDDDDEINETLVINEDLEISKGYKSMSAYLDKLD